MARVDRLVKDGGGDVNHGSGPHGAALLRSVLDHLDALSFQYVQDLLDSGMIVPFVSLSWLERHYSCGDVF